jgi:lipoprotein NlpI
MSIILDALKKAEEERRQEQGTITYGTTPPKKVSRKPLAIVAAGIVVTAGLILLLVLIVPRSTTTVQTVQAPATLLPAKAHLPASKPAVEEKPAVQKAPAVQERRAEAAPDRPLMAKAVSPVSPPAPPVRRESEAFAPVPSKSQKVAVAAPPRQTATGTRAPGPKSLRDKEERTTAPTPAEVSGGERVVVSRMGKQDAGRLFGEARRLEEAGRISEAKSAYARILKEYPDHVETLNNLGAMALNQGNPKEALFFFRKILDVKKDYPKVYNNAGLALMMEGNVRLAEEYFRQAIQLDRQGLEPYVNLAAVLRQQRRLEEAGRLLEIPISRDLGSPSLSLSYAIIKDELGQKAEASRFYRQALREGLTGEERTRVTERLRLLEQDQPAPGR